MLPEKKLKQKFRNFKEGRLGRTVDVVLEIALILYVVFFKPYWIIALIIGILAFTAGLFNICWLAPIVGVPFKGETKR